MKTLTRRFYGRAVLALALVLSMAFALTLIGCPGNNEPDRTDPSFLVGTWENDIATFTINEDFTFVCLLVDVGGVGEGTLAPGLVRGRLNYRVSGLGPNDFVLEDLETAALTYPDASYGPGNNTLSLVLDTFDGTLVTLTPNANRTQFTFTSVSAEAQMFFGGTPNRPYDKIPTPQRGDSTFMIGAWQNAAHSFGIYYYEGSFAFQATVTLPVVGSGVLTGILDHTATGLRDNEFVLRELASTNPAINMMVGDFNNIRVVLTPNEAETQFVFTSPNNEMAQDFFGAAGPFVRTVWTAETLEGTWRNAGGTFTIAADLTFTSNLMIVMPPAPAPFPVEVTGRLDDSNAVLGPNWFQLQDLDSVVPGINLVVGEFNGVPVQLVPNMQMSEFTLLSPIDEVQGFFGGAGPFIRDTD